MADDERREPVTGDEGEVRPDAPTVASPVTPPGQAPPGPPSRWSFPVEVGPANLVAFQGWDRYEVGELLGEGGMGQVYKAFDPRLKRPVALKILRVQDPELLKRFLLEAQNQARVDHPNVCKVYEVGDVGGQPYIAMQYVGGRTLDAATRDLTLEQRVLLMKQVAEAVHAAHQLGLIHRDIKPSNVLVERTKEEGLIPYVTDFGIAREAAAPHLTATGTVTGTPQYMSPEQARGLAVLDRRTDVYSLGATLYELLAGQPPFTGATAVDTLIHVIDEDPTRLRVTAPSVPADLETIVMKCLEKEPSRRYDSAKALAEDLQRFLSGDPIQARRASLAYRLAKKARKNRLLTVVSALSLLAIAVLLGLWGSTRARSAERARLAQRFGQETEMATAALRYAYMMPLHDTRPELAKVEETLGRIDREAQSLGGVARGAGDYAVGRALVALRRPREARVRLERAWSAGYREPEAAYALGQALGMIYQEEAEQARRVSNADLREARLAALDQSLRQPALAYLRQSAGATLEAPAYARGLIALYALDFDGALKRAREAKAEVPWLYEADLLEAEALYGRGAQAQSRGQLEPALADLAASGRACEEAALLARSAPPVYVSDAARSVVELEILGSQGKPLEGALKRILDACGKALEADPGNVAALNEMARAYWRMAETNIRTGGDPIPPLKESMAAAERILAAHPDDAQAQTHLGSALNRMADYLSSKGQDPEPLYAQSIEHLQKALALEPDHPFILNNLGLNYWRRGQYRLAVGKDPRADLDQAASYFQRASSVVLAPVLVLNTGNVYTTKAIYERKVGQDPTASLEKAVKAYESAVALNPREAVNWSNLGSARFLQAEWEDSKGGDPLPDLKKAEEACLKATELNPKYASAYNNLSNAYLLEGELLAARKAGDPDPAYEKSAQAMAKAREIKPAHYEYCRGAAEVELRRADYAAVSGKSPDAHLLEAAKDAAKAQELNPKNPDVWDTVADGHATLARWMEASGKPAVVEVAKGLEAADAGLAIDPKHAGLLMHKAVLLSLRAAAEKDPPSRARDLAQAKDLVAKARALFPESARQRELDACAKRVAQLGG